MVFCFPFAHIPSRFTDDRCRSHNIDAVDLGQVRTGHAKQPFTQIELRLISFFLLEPLRPFLFWQRSTLASIFRLLKIMVELTITLGHLSLAKLVTILFLVQHKRQILLPVTLQTEGDLLLTGLHSRISKGCQLTWITFTCQDGFNDRLSCHSTHIAQHIGQLNIHLR